MTVTERSLPFSKKLVSFALYDAVEKQNGQCVRDKKTGELTAELSVYGNRSSFCLSLAEENEITRLSIAMLCPGQGLSEQGEQRAVHYLADCIEQTLENELLMSAYKKNGGKKK